MHWIIQSIICTFALGIYNLLIATAGKKLDSGISSKAIFFTYLMVVAGILSSIFLVIFYIKDKKTVSTVINKKINTVQAIITVLLLIIPMILMTNAYNTGPAGIVSAIVNMNLFIVLIGGVLLFEDKVNTKIILSLIAAFIAISVASYESNKINK